MEGEIGGGEVPCSSLAVDSILRIGTAGVIWGLCIGPYDAHKLGLTGITRASFVAKSAGKFGFQCVFSFCLQLNSILQYSSTALILEGLFAGMFTITRCGVQRYRKKNDWVNALIAGAVAGAAVGAGSRSWKQVAGMAGLISAVCAVADNSRTH